MQKWLLAVVIVLSGSVSISESFANNRDVRQVRRLILGADLDRACGVSVEKERNDGDLDLVVNGAGHVNRMLVTDCKDVKRRNGGGTRCTRIYTANETRQARTCILDQIWVHDGSAPGAKSMKIYQAFLDRVPFEQNCTVAYFDQHASRARITAKQECSR